MKSKTIFWILVLGLTLCNSKLVLAEDGDEVTIVGDWESSGGGGEGWLIYREISGGGGLSDFDTVEHVVLDDTPGDISPFAFSDSEQEDTAYVDVETDVVVEEESGSEDRFEL